MTAFEFFTVLLSIVVSLGVASLLTAVSRLVQESHRVQFSLTHALWLVAIFNLQITYWLKAWTYRTAYELHVTTSIPPLALAIIAFFACALATPPIPDDGPIDLRDFHTRQVRKYAISMAAFFVGAIAQSGLMDPVIDVAVRVIDTLIQLVYVGMFLLAAIYRRTRWLQQLVPVVFIIGSAFYYTQLIGL